MRVLKDTGFANRARPYSAICSVVIAVLLLSACSVKQFALNRAGDALAEGGSSYASDNDPQLVREAAPFSLKSIESLLEATPKHEGLLLAATRGFTQYAFAFVQQDADRLEDRDIKASQREAARAKNFYGRARDYGLRGLEVGHAGITKRLHGDMRKALGELTAKDVPLMYWTATAWAALIGLSKESPDTVADLPIVQAMVDRAATLNERYDDGGLQTLLIQMEMVRQGAKDNPILRARQRFAKAIEYSKGQQAAPYVTYAEVVTVGAQDKTLFEQMLGKALSINADAVPRLRLANIIMQDRARWLLTRKDQLFSE